MRGRVKASQYPVPSDYQFYKEWKEEVEKRDVSLWSQVDGWFFPTPKNPRSDRNAPQYYHMCEANWKTSTTSHKTGQNVQPCNDSCLGCGEVIPDGIKMIMALLSWE